MGTTTTTTVTTTTTTSTTTLTTTITTTTTTTTTTLTSTPDEGQCSDFSESTCPIDEDTMVGFRHTATPQECQELCRDNMECLFFTWFENQCYLLNSCADNQSCPGCISGPQYPDVDTCGHSSL